MQAVIGKVARPPPATDKVSRFLAIRQQTLALCSPLEPEDYVVQSMPCASPVKWHLAHTSWFFEQFLLAARPGYRFFDERYQTLFNSYYQSLGAPFPREHRGLLSRPTVREVLDYRARVDERMEQLIHHGLDETQMGRLELGLHHEQQHQELMLMDVKHLFSLNPLSPQYCQPVRCARSTAVPSGWVHYPGGVVEIGAGAEGFAFDNERPRHTTMISPYALGERLVTNGEYLDFIEDGGYRRSAFWLADGWDWVRRESIGHPLYWSADHRSEFTLCGREDLDHAAPVSHVSYYEADAFARWAGARLPTEFEWEVAAPALPSKSGVFLEAGHRHPQPCVAGGAGPHQMFGDLWEWTASPYTAYPGFRPAAGALAEYNEKFMCSQIVLRGGSCVTPADHIRASYRNFFYPGQRWQFAGIRMARDNGAQKPSGRRGRGIT